METSGKNEIDMEEEIAAMDITHNNSTLLARGSNVMLFSPGKNEVIKAYDAKMADKSPFTPKKLSLYDKSAKTLFLTPMKKNVIVVTDTETGTPLRELKLTVADNIASPINDFSYDTKFTNYKHSSEVIPLKVASLNRILDMNWDSRTKDHEYVVANMEDKASAINTKGFRFTSVTVNENGGIAAASNDGVVRLYSEIGKRAKTSIDQYSGVPIIGIDNSSDGKWVLWTTKDFLALCKVAFKTEKGVETTGFQTAMGKNKLPTMILKISEEDMKKNGINPEEIHFTTARFDCGPALGASLIEERYVVTSTGLFTITWNMRQLEVDYKRFQSGDVEDRNFTIARPRIYRQGSKVRGQMFNYNTQCVAATEKDINVVDME